MDPVAVSQPTKCGSCQSRWGRTLLTLATDSPVGLALPVLLALPLMALPLLALPLLALALALPVLLTLALAQPLAMDLGGTLQLAPLPVLPVLPLDAPPLYVPVLPPDVPPLAALPVALRQLPVAVAM